MEMIKLIDKTNNRIQKLLKTSFSMQATYEYSYFLRLWNGWKNSVFHFRRFCCCIGELTQKGIKISLINIRIVLSLLLPLQALTINCALVCASVPISGKRDNEGEMEKHISITSEGGKEKEIKSKSASKIMTDYNCYLFYSFSLSPFSSFLHDLCWSCRKYSGPSLRMLDTRAFKSRHTKASDKIQYIT